MRSLVERLHITACVIFSPLLAATSASRKRPAPRARRPAAAHKPSAVRPPRGKKPPARPRPAAAKKIAARPEKGTRRAGGKQKGPEPPATKKGEAHPRAEPLPKPVAPVGRAILLAPENGKYADSIYPKFRWLSVGGANRYEVAWSERPDFGGSYTVISIATEATVPVEKPLRVGSHYYWRVRGGNEGGWGPWSPGAQFQVLEEPPSP